MQIESALKEKRINIEIIDDMHVKIGAHEVQGKVQNSRIIPHIDMAWITNRETKIRLEEISSFVNSFEKTRGVRRQVIVPNTLVLIFMKEDGGPNLVNIVGN